MYSTVELTMALWQYHFQLLPNKGFRTLSTGLSLPRDEDGFFDEEPYWKSHSITSQFFEPVAAFLDKGKPWAKDMLLFGCSDGDCLEVYSRNGTVFSASFRLKINQDYSHTLMSIIDFCSTRSLALVDEHLTVLPYDFATISQIIENSSQRRKYDEFAESD